MGDEHDSWLGALGVTGFNASDITASVGSGLGKAVSGIGDAVRSGARAVGDVAAGDLDAATAAGAAVLGGVEHIEAGILDAVGAHDTAKEMRDFGNEIQGDARRYARDADRDFADAKKEVFGVDPILPPPPPPGTPPMPPIPPPPKNPDFPDQPPSPPPDTEPSPPPSGAGGDAVTPSETSADPGN
jgi:hypothetical protein